MSNSKPIDAAGYVKCPNLGCEEGLLEMQDENGYPYFVTCDLCEGLGKIFDEKIPCEESDERYD